MKETGYFIRAGTEIEPLLPPDDISSLLEIGCGAGETLRWLRSIRNVEHAIGIELIPEVAGEAKLIFDEVKVGNIESMDLGFQPATFDTIIVLDVLEHLIDPWLIIRRCHEFLRPGGIMIASIPNVAHYSVTLPLVFQGRWNYEDEGLLDRTHLRFFGAKTAIDLMSSSGLILEQVKGVRILPNWLSRIPERLGGRRLRWYASRLLYSLPPRHLLDFRFLIRVRRC